MTAAHAIAAVPTPNRRRIVVAAAGLLLLGIVALLVLRGGPDPYEPLAIVDANALDVAVPTAVAAGSAFDITVGNLETNSVLVTVDDGYSVRRFEQAPTDGEATIRIPPQEGPSSGIVRVSALAGLRAGTASVPIAPSTAVDPHDLYLGPRTILADGVDHTMIVAVPKDRFGNPVATGTEVTYIVTRPDLSVEEAQHETDDLLSFSRIISRTTAGKTRIAVTADETTAREMTFLAVATIPEPFGLTIVDPVVPADGVTVVRVRTDVLADQFGNVLPDGMDATLDIVGVSGTRRIKGQTIKGVAEFSVEAPSRPGDVTMTASTSGRSSASSTVSFPAAVTRIPFATGPDDDGLRVSIGPVLTTRGGYVAEGTMATVRVGDESFAAPMGNGIVDIVVPANTASFDIDVLGHTTSWCNERCRAERLAGTGS